MIHGGVHDSSCWEPVIAPLRALGHDVQAFDLPGRGQNADDVGKVTLEDSIGCVSAAVDAVSEPPVLVGHSMGGVSTSALAERRPGDIRGIVYVSAVVPIDGATAVETLLEAGDKCLLLADGGFVFSEDGTTAHVPPSRGREAFYNRCDDAVAEAVVAQMCTEAVGPLTTPVTLGAGFASVPKTYIGATEDRVVPPALQHTLAERCGAAFVTIDSDHSPFFSATDALVALLAEHG
jgi:pimeloyl-ACP methyl ester carboxylesterase